MTTPTKRHSVQTWQTAGAWQARCICGAAAPRPTTHKPVVEDWRRQHYRTGT